MHLGVARLCLDCHEVHEYDRCPSCTSEAFAFITRWVKLEDAARQMPPERNSAPDADKKLETYRQILQPDSGNSHARQWMRNGSLLLTAAYVARLGWLLARHTRDSDAEKQSRSDVPRTARRESEEI